MIREEKKLLFNNETLTRNEIENYRRKKLKEVRKGLGAGRPIQPKNYLSRSQINDMRDAMLLKYNN
jgi:hypothetical protein